MDYADEIAKRILSGWEDARTVEQIVAEGVREGYALGLGVSAG